MKMTKFVGFGLLLLVLIAVGPFITIWALNTLFGLGIAYTFWTWVAVVWLGLVLQTKIGGKSS